MRKGCDSPDMASGESANQCGYFFLPAADLAAAAAFFLALALLACALFWPDFFWLAFGDLSPITFILVLRLTGRRHGIFSASNRRMRDSVLIVNARRKPSSANGDFSERQHRLKRGLENQAQAARIASAFTTCSAEPVKAYLNFPARRVTRTSMVFRPLFFIARRSCL